ncbi:MAG TPA: PEP-CTERM sorting domain-containing protein [Opitutaceae bacterium]|nr:PEP-CTERM sorting domain-containing protein [Opitutaceae bacterium]
MKSVCFARGAPPRRSRLPLAPIVSLLIFAAAAAVRAPGQLVVYSFGPTAAPTAAATFIDPGLSASVFSGLAGGAGTGTGTPVFTAGSGGGFFSASAWNGAAPGPNFFEFTITPAAGVQFTATAVSFGYRATGSGPTAFAVRASLDAFASDLATGTFLTDSTWHDTGAVALSTGALDTATTFRIYASGASSSLGTLRVDDLALAGSIGAVPEPATWGAVLGVAALSVAVRRRRLRSAPPSPAPPERGNAAG